MFHMLFHICLCWLVAVYLHELGHLFVGPIFGCRISSINLFCAPPNLKNGSFITSPFFTHGPWRIGFYFLTASVAMTEPPGISGVASAAIDFAGPLVNAMLALFFFQQGDQAAMLVNLFLIVCAREDIYQGVQALCERNVSALAGVVSIALWVPMLWACITIATWWAYSLLGLSALFVLVNILANRLEEKDALARAQTTEIGVSNDPEAREADTTV
jgi:hypothetical protein